MTTKETLLRASDLALHLRCGKSTIYKLAKQGQIPVVRIGMTGVRFDIDEVLEALKR